MILKKGRIDTLSFVCEFHAPEMREGLELEYQLKTIQLPMSDILKMEHFR